MKTTRKTSPVRKLAAKKSACRVVNTWQCECGDIFRSAAALEKHYAVKHHKYILLH